MTNEIKQVKTKQAPKESYMRLAFSLEDGILKGVIFDGIPAVLSAMKKPVSVFSVMKDTTIATLGYDARNIAREFSGDIVDYFKDYLPQDSIPYIKSSIPYITGCAAGSAKYALKYGPTLPVLALGCINNVGYELMIDYITNQALGVAGTVGLETFDSIGQSHVKASKEFASKQKMALDTSLHDLFSDRKDAIDLKAIKADDVVKKVKETSKAGFDSKTLAEGITAGLVTAGSGIVYLQLKENLKNNPEITELFANRLQGIGEYIFSAYDKISVASEQVQHTSSLSGEVAAKDYDTVATFHLMD
jgi:hypothetical protein